MKRTLHKYVETHTQEQYKYMVLILTLYDYEVKNIMRVTPNYGLIWNSGLLATIVKSVTSDKAMKKHWRLILCISIT